MDEFINLLPIFLVFVIFYLVLYLPQRRRAKKHDEFIENVAFANPGFINITFKPIFWTNFIEKIINNSKTFGVNQNEKKNNYLIEFVSANPTGPLHIAHIRGAVFGDVLSSLYTKTGFDVTREYYVNDAGSQIDKLSNSLLKRYLQFFDKKIELEEDEYPGEYLIDIAKKIKNEDANFIYNAVKNINYETKFKSSELLNPINFITWLIVSLKDIL